MKIVVLVTILYFAWQQLQDLENAIYKITNDTNQCCDASDSTMCSLAADKQFSHTWFVGNTYVSDHSWSYN